MKYWIAPSLLILLFLVPYFVLISHFSFSFQTSVPELWVVIQNTLWQALGSAMVSLFLGIIGGLGLLWLSRILKPKVYFWVEKFILIPNLVPSLFVIISCLGIIRPFPFGKVGIILVHSIMNLGLIAILFKRICRSKLGSISELCLVEGASAWQFFRVGVLSYLKSDLAYLFLFVFFWSVVSFNVPLMLGGPTGATLEVLIYEKVMIHQSWSEAIGLSLLQLVILGIVTLVLNRLDWSKESRTETKGIEFMEWKWGCLIPIIASIIVFYSPIHAIPNGWQQLHSLGFSWLELLDPIFNSFKIGLMGSLILLLLALVASLGIEWKIFRTFSTYFISPGPVLLGLSFYLVKRLVNLNPATELEFSLPGQIIFGLSILYFWSLYRLALFSPQQGLLHQIELAQTMGATPFQILYRITAPQLFPHWCFMCGIGAMWFCGDFAFSRMIAPSDFHLALIIKSLASYYRLDAAQLLMFILYLISMVLFGFWWRLGHVFNQKFNSQAK